jgi:subtilisin family serine protease
MSMGSYSQDDWTCFHDGAKQHPHILFVISAGNDGFDIDVNPVFPASFDLENIVVVTSSDLFGRLPPQSNYGRVSVDLMVPAEQVDVFDHRGVFTTASGSSFAAPRVAALAARFLKKNVEASTADIIDFLKSRAINSGSTPVRFGWIPDPSDDFKL